MDAVDGNEVPLANGHPNGAAAAEANGLLNGLAAPNGVVVQNGVVANGLQNGVVAPVDNVLPNGVLLPPAPVANGEGHLALANQDAIDPPFLPFVNPFADENVVDPPPFYYDLPPIFDVDPNADPDDLAFVNVFADLEPILDELAFINPFANPAQIQSRKFKIQFMGPSKTQCRGPSMTQHSYPSKTQSWSPSKTPAQSWSPSKTLAHRELPYASAIEMQYGWTGGYKPHTPLMME